MERGRKWWKVVVDSSIFHFSREVSRTDRMLDRNIQKSERKREATFTSSSSSSSSSSLPPSIMRVQGPERFCEKEPREGDGRGGPKTNVTKSCCSKLRRNGTSSIFLYTRWKYRTDGSDFSARCPPNQRKSNKHEL